MSIDAIAWAFAQDVKPAARKFVLIAIADNADQHGICWPSYKHIAQKTGLTKRSVIDHCAELVKNKLIQKAARTRQNQSHTSNAYLLNMGLSIEDHPFHFMFTPSENISPPSEYSAPPSENISPPSEYSAPLEPSYNHSVNQREREPLTREEFLRGVDEGIQGGGFDGDFIHLTETEIIAQAAECWDRWGENLEARNPTYVMRSWLRKGMSLGTVRKASKASKVSEKEEIALNNIADWQVEALGNGIFNEGEFKSWILGLEWNGSDRVYAPTRFIAENVEKRYMQQLRKALHSNIIIEVKTQERACSH